MSKIDLDKYYTDKTLAKYCTEKMVEYTGTKDIYCVEPSAGNGSFLESIKENYDKHLFLDIAPEHESIVEQDYLKFDCNIGGKVVALGNPPFGRTNSLIVKFFKRSIKFAEYIGFILPISQLNNTKQLYEFDLLYSEDEYIRGVVSKIDWREEISCISAKKLPKGLALEIVQKKLIGTTE